MSKISTFIQKLWVGQLSQEEAGELSELLRNKDTDLRKELNDSFNRTIAEEQSAEEYNKALEIFGKLLLKIAKTEKRKVSTVFIIKSMSWAAALIVLVFTVIQIHKPNKPVIASTNITSSQTKDITSLKSFTNNTKDKMMITLEDSSVVTLFSNSTISYRKNFDGNGRNIKLEGMAYFKVAKDIHKPFIVLSGGFTTTALGTEFSVDIRQTGKVQVKLYQGKVVVQSAQKESYLKKDIYLMPMQSFTANITTGQFAVNNFNQDKYLLAERKSKDWSGELVRTELNFSNEPLDHVFDQLNEEFRTNIKYSKRQLKGHHFTGTVFKTDSLKTIITIISKMNGLTFEEQEGNILIHQ